MGHVTLRMPVAGLVWSLTAGLLFLVTLVAGSLYVGVTIGRAGLLHDIQARYVEAADSAVAQADSAICGYGGVCDTAPD